MTAPVDRSIVCAMPSGLPSLPLLAEVAVGRRALPAGIPSLNALLRLDPLWVLRLLRAADRVAAPAHGGLSARIDAVIDACGEAMLQAALLCDHDRARAGAEVPAGYRAFWAHSLLTAEIARELALRGATCDPEDAFIAGLLLDVGLPLRAGSLSGVDDAANEHELAVRESAASGLNHGEFGASLLASGWAADLAEALRFSHTDPRQFGDAPEFLRVARAAEELASGVEDARATVLAMGLANLTPDLLDTAMQLARARTHGRCLLLDLGESGLEAGGDRIFRPALQRVDPVTDGGSAMLDIARSGLLDRMCARGDEALLVSSMKLASGLLLDLPAPLLFRARNGAKVFAPVGAPSGSTAEVLDMAQPGAAIIARTLAEGLAWRCFDPRQAAALPVGLQRVLGLRDGWSCLLQPLMSESGIEALALYTLPATFQPRTAELAALASATGRGLRQRAVQARELGELRLGMAEQVALNARQLRADLESPLGLLRHQVKSMRLKMGADSMVDSELSVVGDQIQRIDTVLRQFEARPPDVSAEAQRVDLNLLIEQSVSEAEDRLLRARSISTELHLDAALPPLHLPLGKLREIVSTLLVASAEQVGTTGRIAVSTADGVNLNGTLFAEIRVRDFGRGMDAARVAALFSPDGRLDGRSSLAQALSLVRSLGGTLSCKSAVGQGTVFQLLLPRQTRRIASAQPV